MSSSNPTDQFIQQRSRLMETTGGIAANNRRVRLLNFERAMKAQFGPNVVVSPDGVATRRGKEVGNLDAFMKAGGKLQGTPKDPRSELQIREKENEKLAENYTPPTFEQTMEGMFPKAKERISSKTFESDDGGVNLDEMSQYTDTGEQDTGDYTDLADLVSAQPTSAGTNKTSTRDRLNIGPATGRAAMRAQNVKRFGEERVSYLERQNTAFQDMKKGKISKEQFAKDFPKSNLAKRLRLKLKK